VRTEKWKYFRYRFIDAPEALYNLEEDPLETNNLALQAEYHYKLDSLRSICDQKIDKFTKMKKMF
jgi:hypothetical protein